jgi:hypothetical protein
MEGVKKMTKTVVRIVDIPAEIWNEYLPNISKEHYHYANPFVSRVGRNNLQASYVTSTGREISLYPSNCSSIFTYTKKVDFTLGIAVSFLSSNKIT